MTFDVALAQLAGRYRAQGYVVTIEPGPDDLPDFARGFDVKLCCRRDGGGVLVAAFADQAALAADPRVSMYAETTSAQPAWRFDLAILGPLVPRPDPNLGDVRDLSADQIRGAVATAERAADLGFAREVFVTSWGTLEAAARLRLHQMPVAGRAPTPWRELASGLLSDAAISYDEFDRLNVLFRTRNRLAHGFADADVDEQAVRFVSKLTRRLRDESAAQTVSAF